MPPSGRENPTRAAVWPTITIAACVAAVCAPLLAHGPLPLGSDVYSTSHYLQGFMKAFSEGDLYPRWTDRSNQGLGAPSFVMFPPLAYYGAGAASWMAGSIISGFKLYLVAVAILTFLSFHALARQWIGPGLPAAMAAGLYLLLPYHVLDIYQRFAISETTAFVFFPLILLFARRAMLVGGARDLAGLSLANAGLIYTHIVSSLSFSLLFGIWLLWETRGRWRALLRPGLALACGLALAAPALLPAALEKSHANIAWVREMPNGDFRINFIFKDEVLPGLGIKDPVKPPVLKSAHSQLLLAGLAAALALAWTSREQRRRRRDVLALGAGCALAFFLQLEISTPVWRFVPELATIQFPWRLQTLMVLTAALLSGFALSAGWGRAGGASAAARSRMGPAAVALGAAVLINLGLAGQNAFLKPFQYDEELNRDPRVVQWMEPAFTPVQFEPYRRFKQMTVTMPQAAFTSGAGEARVELWASSRRRILVDSPAGGKVELRSFWFPGWTGRIDGLALELHASQNFGNVMFTVPAGRHTVELSFEPTPLRRFASLTSIAALLLTLALAWAAPRLAMTTSAFRGSSRPKPEAGI